MNSAFENEVKGPGAFHVVVKQAAIESACITTWNVVPYITPFRGYHATTVAGRVV